MKTDHNDTLLETSCTHCQSTFSITNEELDFADGQVRCSSCHEVFDAYFHLTQIENPIEDNDEDEEELESDLDDNNFDKILDNETPDPESQNNDNYLNQSDLLDSEIINSDLLQDDFSQPELIYSEIDGTEILEEHSTEERIIETDSIDPDSDSDRFEPDLFSTEISETMLKEAELSEPEFYDSSFSSSEFSESDPTELEIPILEAEEIEKIDALNKETISNKKELSETKISEPSLLDIESVVSAEYLEENPNPIPFDTNYFETQSLEAEQVSLKEAMNHGTEKKPGFSSKLFWLVGILLLIILMAAQLIYSQRFTLIKDQNYQPFVLAICSLIPCENHKFKSLNQLELLERNIFTHPEKENALQISGSFINNAPFTQSAPSLNVRLFNTQGQIIAQRIFSFLEYRQVHKSKNFIESNDSMTFKIEVEDPNIETITYEIDFL